MVSENYFDVCVSERLQKMPELMTDIFKKISHLVNLGKYIFFSILSHLGNNPLPGFLLCWIWEVRICLLSLGLALTVCHMVDRCWCNWKWTRSCTMNMSLQWAIFQYKNSLISELTIMFQNIHLQHESVWPRQRFMSGVCSETVYNSQSAGRWECDNVASRLNRLIPDMRSSLSQCVNFDIYSNQFVSS